MAWTTDACRTLLDSLSDPNSTMFDVEVFDKVEDLWLRVQNSPGAGKSLIAAPATDSRYEARFKALIAANKLLQSAFFVSEALDRWPKQVVFLVYTPNASGAQAGPGLLMFNVLVRPDADLLYNTTL